MSKREISNIDLDNPEFQNAWNLIRNTRQSVFLTGKAGTGKSTFLKYICAHTAKKYVVLAPTGIAAVNVGGQTLHSFFKIPFKPLLPDDPDFSPRRIRKTLRYTKEKIKLIQQLDLIIIDEISMVRADIIDFVDRVLRTFSGDMREPFGGKQLLFVGDVFQLEPVVTRDMRDILRRYYKQFFFFNAHVFGQLGLVPIELRKVYRQTDPQFIALLDRVRVSHATATDLAALNAHCNPAYNDQGKYVMTLATRRDTVNAINDQHMAALKTPEFVFHGEIKDTFPENDLPTSLDLALKKGAQVMFIRNDKEGRWVNGTIAQVSDVGDDFIEVTLEGGESYRLEPEMWENIQYRYNEKEHKVEEDVLGTFTQFPIKPAWALTVHKSQGLTFNNVVIDFAGGAFTSGQTYVALSRCTSLQGITLLRPLSERDIIVNGAVTDFSRQFNNQALITRALDQEKASQLYIEATVAFNHGQFRKCVESFAQAMAIKNEATKPAVQRLIALKLQRFNRQQQEIDKLQQVIDSQNQLLRQLAKEYVDMGNQSLGYGTLAGEDDVPYGEREPGTGLDEVAIKSAKANYEKALRLWPQCIDALLGLGRLYMTIDQLKKAEATMKQALEIDPDNFDVHMALAELYGVMRNVPAAIKSYKRAAKADKKAPQPHEALASIYEHLGMDDLAESEAQKAQKLHKRNAKRKKQS